MTDLHSEASSGSRSARLDRAIRDLLAQAPELEAAAVVSFDGLPMAAALPPSMDEDRVAAMSAALLSLGERAAQGLGRGELSQVYIEGDDGTVFLVSADDEAVLVAVAAKGAKAGMMLYEVRRSAAVIAAVLRAEDEAPEPARTPLLAVAPERAVQIPAQAVSEPPASYAPAGSAPSGYPPATAALSAWDAPARATQPAPSYEPLTAPTYAERGFASSAPAQPAPVDALYDLPLYDVPVRDVPVHDVPVRDVPVHDVPVRDVPVQDVPSYLTAAEPVWPLHSSTGSVMPGGGVPPSTWS